MNFGQMTGTKMGGYDVPFGKVVTAKDMPAFKTPSQLKEEEDHEVSMAQSSLDSIIKYATELKAKLGNDEKEIPAWIQDHISKAENFIQQASSQYHEYGGGEMSEGYKKGDWVIVDNPHWKAQSGKESKQRRKVRMVTGSGSDATLFFSDGSNSDSKYVTKAGKNESINEVESKTFKVPTQMGMLHIETEEDPGGVFVDVMFNKVTLATVDIQYPTGTVKVTEKTKRVKLKEASHRGSDLNEGKNDFVATHSGATITLKNGYKHHSEDKLNSLYDKLGKMVKGLKVKNVQLVFEDKSTKTGK